MNAKFELNLARVDEAEALSTLMVQTFLAAYGDVAPPDRLQRHIASSYAADLIADRLSSGEIEIWVLNANPPLIGAGDAGYLQLGLRSKPPRQLAGRRALEVQRCYLRPEYIGGGAGSLLIQQAQQRAADLAVDAIYLSVYQLAPRAVRFYEKHGFRAAAPVKYYIDDIAFDDWLMVWVR